MPIGKVAKWKKKKRRGKWLADAHLAVYRVSPKFKWYTVCVHNTYRNLFILFVKITCSCSSESTPFISFGKIFQTAFYKMSFLVKSIVAASLLSVGTCTECFDYTTEKSCMSASQGSENCAWCKSAAVGSSCNTESDAKSLPDSIFFCEYQTPVTFVQKALNFLFNWRQ